MSPTRRRSIDRFDQHRSRTAKVVTAAAALTLVSGTVVLTHASASSDYTASAPSGSGAAGMDMPGMNMPGAPTGAPSGDPSASAPAAGDPSASAPAAGDPSASAPAAGDPSASAPAAGDPSASDPSSSAPSAGDPSSSAPSSSAPPSSAPATSAPAAPPALEILGNTCDGSKLAPHTGFQDGNRCVSTEFGEVGTEDKNPTLLITSAPRFVRVNQAFDIKVSTRNIVRDRFLKAAIGGYYKESSFLTADGLVRGHFHTACRMLAATNAAPQSAPVPAFFLATEDGKGGADPDTVTIHVTGMPQSGIAQCASWAGDGSHRVPMMQRANQIPAFDSVRIRVF
jgi:hypothetical protein